MMYISEHDLVLTTALLVFGGIIAAVSAMFVARTLRERSLDVTLERLLVGIEETEMQTAFYTLDLRANAPPSSARPPGVGAQRTPPS